MPSDFAHPPGGYVFVITYGRSGSTLLQNILNAIPGYQVRGENNNAILPLAQSWQAVNGSEPMRGARRAGRETSPEDPFYGAEKVDPTEYGQALAATFARMVLRPDPGTRVSGFKEIRFHLHPRLFGPTLDFIRQFFPRTRFVFNTRDLAAVSRSGWWANMDPKAVQAELSAAETLFSNYVARHPRICHQVQYDTYVQAPETLQTLFDFLGEEMNANMIERVLNTPLDHARTPGGR
ncbi:sulfotransferase [Salipiger aestuarii]|uniref:Sulfotransferase family protein n=1 Tax=Salipiger aestuarii TaxID=568098 RepID=A0A327XHR8_9RHOB|nr:sulfotransferase [Salipiger aestuarii]RAK07811.1 sulfotransferase family protein [Salipiger aestuarii]